MQILAEGVARMPDIPDNAPHKAAITKLSNKWIILGRRVKNHNEFEKKMGAELSAYPGSYRAAFYAELGKRGLMKEYMLSLETEAVFAELKIQRAAIEAPRRHNAKETPRLDDLLASIERQKDALVPKPNYKQAKLKALSNLKGWGLLEKG